MRRNILLLLLLLSVSIPAFSQQITVQHESMDRTRLSFSASLPEVSTVTMGEDRWNLLSLPGCSQGGKVGEPSLPVKGELLEIPVCEEVRVVVTEMKWDTVSLNSIGCQHRLLPMQPSRLKSDTTFHPLTLSDEAYSHGWIGDELAKVEVIGIARDRRLAKLVINPIRYNPTDNTIALCKSATIEIQHLGVDGEATRRLHEYYSPAFHIGHTTLNSIGDKSGFETAPIRYLIVAHESFRGELDSLLHWKQRKGFLADIVYTDDPQVGNTSTSIANYLRSQYNSATASRPAPTYVLLVGDVEQIPAFAGVAFYPNHPTDLYYATWTSGDHLPDCHYGRFSAKTLSHLAAQVDKTLDYEQYAFADDAFLSKAILVSGIDINTPSYSTEFADPSMDYIATLYANATNGLNSVAYYKNNTAINPNASGVTVYSNINASTALRGKINEGSAFTFYSGHGTTAGWYSPSLYFNNVSSLSNYGKYGIMVANCCLSNKYDDSESLGEMLLRRVNAGAVGYIGASNSTHWRQDFYFAVGIRSNISSTMYQAYNPNFMGMADRLFHTHGESLSDRSHTMGAMVMAGQMSIQSDVSGFTDTALSHYYWEVYNLIGDPSLTPWLRCADTLAVSVSSPLSAGATHINITTEPYAFVALTTLRFGERVLIASSYANGNGSLQLAIPSGLYAGAYELAVSAQNHITRFMPLNIMPGEGAYVKIVQVSLPSSIQAGETVNVSVQLRNQGTATARHNALTLSTNILGMPTLSFPIDTLAAGGTLTHSFPLALPGNIQDQQTLRFTVECTWDSCPMPSVAYASQTVNAPNLAVTLLSDGELTPGSTEIVELSILNNGHAPLNDATLSLSQPLPLITLYATDTVASIACGATLSRHYRVIFDQQLPANTQFPFFASITTAGGYSLTSTQTLSIGVNSFEDFESGNLSQFNWNNNANPWEVTSAESHSGTYCARSKSGLANNGTSDLSIQWSCSIADSITFYYKVSTEESDIFYFMIDGTPLFASSGTYNTTWQRAAYPVAAGTHTYQFYYTKDFMMSGGSDAIFIDDIHFPSAPMETHEIVYAYDTTCQHSTYTYDNQTVNTQMSGQVNCGSTLPNGDIEVLLLTILPVLQSYQQAIACDTYEWNGTTLTQSGDYSSTLTSSFGCDSTAHLQLTIHLSQHDTLVVDTMASDYLFNGITYQESGVYSYQTQTVQGCDSLVTLFLTLTADTTSQEDILSLADAPSLLAYPNPTTGWIQLSGKATTASLYDMKGTLLSKQQEVEVLNLSHLSRGTYLLVIESQHPASRTILKIEKL